MQYHLSLRSLLLLVSGLAVTLMLVSYGLRNQEQMLFWRLGLVALAPCILFALFALTYLVTLPIGLLNKLYQDLNEPATSPFSTDRLPDRVAYSDDASD